MRSNKERRKVISDFTATAGSQARSIMVGALAAISLFPTISFGQKTEKDPVLSVLRQGMGIVNNLSEKKTSFTINDIGLEAVTGDFDADGVLDGGTFDPAAALFAVRSSGDGSTSILSIARSKGKAVVVPADYDGDKRSDLAVWWAGTWQMLLSSRGHSADVAVFGISGDVPVPADYDGDGKADLAVFRPSEDRWYIRNSGNGHVRTVDFGKSGTDLLLPADYSGDGKADLALYRNGVWIVIDSETGIEDTFSFGFEDAKPVPADFDRDGVTDFAVYRKGIWYVYEGSRLVSYKFGDENDIPLTDVRVRQSTTGR